MKGSAEEVGWASLQAEVARLDCLMAKNQLEVHLQRLIELSTISHGYTTPDSPIHIRFYRDPSKQFAPVLQEEYSPVKVDDVAFLLLDQLPEGVAPVILGSALHNEDHQYRLACRAAQDDRRGS